MVRPEHIEVTPVIAAGNGLTNTVVVIRQPVGNVYVITVVLGTPGPGFTPVTVVVGLGPVITVATVIRLLLHVPPMLPSLSCVVRPAHIVVLPVIVVGNGLTVTFTLRVQPVPNV